jgi:hypothetical protein
VGGTSGQILYNSGGSATSSSNFKFDGTTIRANGLYPLSDDSGNVGNSANTWNNGFFTNLTVDSTLNVRSYIDLADSDGIRFGSNDDARIFYDGTNNDLELELEADSTSFRITDNATAKYIFMKTGKAAFNTATEPTRNFEVFGSTLVSPSALSDTATIAVDFATASNWTLTIDGNRTLGNPTNIAAGIGGVIVITQGSTGGTLAFSSYWRFSGGTAPTLTTGAGAVDVLCYYVESGTRITARIINDVQ